MKEKKIHDMIEQGNSNQKEKSWEVIRNHLYQVDEEEEHHNNGGSILVLVRSKRFIVCVSLVFVILAGMILFLVLFKWNDVEDDFRFYSQGDYNITQTSVTLKEYTEQNDLDILYFDWYDETDSYDVVYTLNDSEEIICYREEIYDNELENIVILFVIEEDVGLDFFEVIESVCMTAYESENADIEIMWGGDSSCVYAYFEYNGYKYYLQVDDIEGETSDILYYAEALLS